MTLRNHSHQKRVSRFYTCPNALILTCLAALFFSGFSFAAETNDFFSLPKHDHPQILAVHDTLAVYKGTETMPENIWPRVSVPFAVFTITEYLNYEIRAKYGREKQKSLNKFLPAKHQKPTPLQEKLLALKEGQTVLLCWEHRGGGPEGQVVNRLEVLTPEQAKRFRSEAVAAKSAKEDRRKQGLHLTREAFLQRLRTLDPKQFSGVKPEELALRTELYLRRPHLTDDDFLRIVKWMPALDNLHLRSAVFPKASLQRLTGLKNLTSLSLPFTGYQNEGLKNVDMPLLSRLKSLKALNLMGTEVRDEGLKAIGELKNLEHLNLKSCWIEGYGLQHLVQLKNLKELDLGRITRGRGIENEGFEHLGKMAKLEKLSLRHCEKFSPKSLDRLKGLKNLKTIDLYYAFAYRDDTSGALPALERFKKALPTCKVTGVQWKRLENNQEREELRELLRQTSSDTISEKQLLEMTLDQLRAEVRPVPKPKHIVIVTSDDQGWIQAGCYGHPFLKTPHLDAMAANGLRFERFYANAPVCSPTRAGILTGRSNNRTGVLEHGYNLNLEETTFVQALRKAGFSTGHFGKWHLNGIRGPGVPVLKDDPFHPGKYGFSHWLTSTNFIDYHPLLSEMGRFDQTKGDASEIIVDRALAFIEKAEKARKPSLSVIWYGAPHSPWIASESDRTAFAHLPIAEQHHYGELVAMDRSIGALRGGLRKLGIADNTLIWFSSDNGGLRKNFGENAVGPLRGGKKDLWEGGLRVPCLIEWPGVIKQAVVRTPCSTLDIAPTIIDLLDLPDDSLLAPVDGESISPIFMGTEMPDRRPIPIAIWDKSALIDHQFKLVRDAKSEHLFNLSKDPKEQSDLTQSHPEQLAKMRKKLDHFLHSIKDSQSGKDYPNGLNTPRRDVQWRDHPEYADHLDQFSDSLKASQTP